MHSLAELEAQAFVNASQVAPVAQPEAGIIVATATSVAVFDPIASATADRRIGELAQHKDENTLLLEERQRVSDEAYDRFDSSLKLVAGQPRPTFKSPEDLIQHVNLACSTSVNPEELIVNLVVAGADYLDQVKSPVRISVVSDRDRTLMEEGARAANEERDNAYAEVHLLRKEIESMQKNPPVFWPVRVGHQATNILKRDKAVWGKFSAAVATEEALVDFFCKDLALRHDLTKAISNERHSARVAKALAEQVAKLKTTAPVGEPNAVIQRMQGDLDRQESHISRLQEQLREAQKGSKEGALVDTEAVDRLSALVGTQDKMIVELKNEIIANQKGVATGTVAELKALAAAIRGAARFNVPGITPELLIQAVEKL